MVGISSIFGWITILLIVYAFFFDFPVLGDDMFLVWLIAAVAISFYTASNKTQLRKNAKTGHWEEITIKKSIVEQETEIHQAEVEARKREQLRQEELGGKKLSKIKKQQELDKKKVITESIEGIGLMDKVKRLKKLYINGTLTKAEFEKAKDKLLK